MKLGSNKFQYPQCVPCSFLGSPAMFRKPCGNHVPFSTLDSPTVNGLSQGALVQLHLSPLNTLRCIFVQVDPYIAYGLLFLELGCVWCWHWPGAHTGNDFSNDWFLSLAKMNEKVAGVSFTGKLCSILCKMSIHPHAPSTGSMQ